MIPVATKSDTHLPAPSDHSRVPSEVTPISVSAISGDGLAELLQRISNVLDAEHEPLSASNPMLTRERHRVALERARIEVAAFLDAWTGDAGLPAVVSAVYLHAARGHLEELVGVLDVEQVLDRVFSSFCVGK